MNKEFVVLACTAYDGSPTMVKYRVEFTDAQYQHGEHYDMAIDMAKDDRYSGPFVCFDATEHGIIISMADSLDNN
jgi:hypothetical protein